MLLLSLSFCGEKLFSTLTNQYYSGDLRWWQCQKGFAVGFSVESISHWNIIEDGNFLKLINANLKPQDVKLWTLIIACNVR